MSVDPSFQKDSRFWGWVLVQLSTRKWRLYTHPQLLSDRNFLLAATWCLPDYSSSGRLVRVKSGYRSHSKDSASVDRLSQMIFEYYTENWNLNVCTFSKCGYSLIGGAPVASSALVSAGIMSCSKAASAASSSSSCALPVSNDCLCSSVGP